MKVKGDESTTSKKVVKKSKRMLCTPINGEDIKSSTMENSDDRDIR